MSGIFRRYLSENRGSLAGEPLADAGYQGEGNFAALGSKPYTNKAILDLENTLSTSVAHPENVMPAEPTEAAGHLAARNEVPGRPAG